MQAISNLPQQENAIRDAILPGRRTLLCVYPASVAPMAHLKILEHQWEVRPVTCINQAQRESENRGLRVGIVVLERWPEVAIGDIEHLALTTPHMHWVALIGSQALASERLRHVILRCFYDFHTIPPDIGRLRVTLGHAYDMATLEQGNIEQTKRCGMIGCSPPMQALYRGIDKAAAVDAPILISGESGAGKELVAVAIHQNSRRSTSPFIAVNCAALPANLVQSELFGYERGAFTGADRRKIGKIEAAAPGTIFLDEIGDLPRDLQVNLLRFLQDRKIERVGSTRSISVDVRVIAATHVDLQRAVTEERFRGDLFYRLNVLHLEVPPLRKRPGDVNVLAQHFFDEFRAERHVKLRGFSRSALEAMERYDWPGNVRELINRVHQAMVMSEQTSITPADLELQNVDSASTDTTLDRARDIAARTVIAAALEDTGFNISKAARRLSTSRVTLYRLMEKYGLQKTTG